MTGTMWESGSQSSSFNESTGYSLAAGQWTLASGSGSGSAGGSSSFGYSGSGSYLRTKAGNPGVGASYSDWSVNGTQSEGGNQDSNWSNGTNSNVVNGVWVSSGPGVVAGVRRTRAVRAAAGRTPTTTAR